METVIHSSSVVLFVIVTVLLSKWFNNLLEWQLQYAEEQESLQILQLFPERKIDELCSEETFYCFVITDAYNNETGRPLAFRRLRLKGPDGVLILSNARLLVPKPMSYKNLDTRKWELDKTTVRLTYARMMISGIFFSEGVEYNSPKVSNILIFGLGGGVINNYLSVMPGQKLNITVVDIDPVMKTVAEKWYGFVETDMHRILVEDGVKFIKKDQDVKYDAILVDLCSNERGPLLCPIEAFLKDDVISNLNYNLVDTGVLIVNIITPPALFEAVSQRVLKRYEEHFTFCVLLPSGAHDRMLFCFKYHPWNNDPNRLHQNVLRMDQELGFHLKDGGVYETSDKE
ncbi:hypothetical protein RB195_021519 [Necator americanus]|uniref:Spermine/spermidine synthase n=1 Tax=Necator americanus TaxID=51031 RepID=A0ABR1EBE9_NECAM